MSLRIYIAYGGPAGQVTALRLQALAAVNGLTVYVSPAYTRQDVSGQLDPQSDIRLREADVVLGLVTFVLSDACLQELNAGRRLASISTRNNSANAIGVLAGLIAIQAN
jgi:hypothetical protein